MATKNVNIPGGVSKMAGIRPRKKKYIANIDMHHFHVAVGPRSLTSKESHSWILKNISHVAEKRLMSSFLLFPTFEGIYFGGMY